MNEEKGNFQTLIDAGVALTGSHLCGNKHPYVVIPSEYSVESLEHLLERPLRKKGSPTFNDIQSFNRYVNAHKTKETVIAATVSDTSGSFAAIFDYHQSGAGDAGWKDHGARYNCPPSPEWARWTRMNGNTFNQAQFAEFIEDNILDIVKPKGAEMLEIAKTLQAKKSVAFRSAIRLENGDNELQYDETTTAQAGKKGAFAIPAKFELGLKPFVNSPAYKVEARLRYRINEGALVFSYELLRPHLVIRDACNDLIETVKKETGIAPFNGAF